MAIDVNGKGLLVTAAFLLVFGGLLDAAGEVEQRVATAGGVAIAAYLLVELLVTFNPAAWWRQGDPRR